MKWSISIIEGHFRLLVFKGLGWAICTKFARGKKKKSWRHTCHFYFLFASNVIPSSIPIQNFDCSHPFSHSQTRECKKNLTKVSTLKPKMFLTRQFETKNIYSFYNAWSPIFFNFFLIWDNCSSNILPKRNIWLLFFLPLFNHYILKLLTIISII